MSRPRKPNLPVRDEMVEDFQCRELNQDCIDDNGPCNICEDREDCKKKYNDLQQINLGELIDIYGENARNIEVSVSHDRDGYYTLTFSRLENDEEFAVRLKEYEKEVVAYNQWVENNTPEKKKEKQEAKRLERLEKLRKKLEELSGKV